MSVVGQRVKRPREVGSQSGDAIRNRSLPPFQVEFQDRPQSGFNGCLKSPPKLLDGPHSGTRVSFEPTLTRTIYRVARNYIQPIQKYIPYPIREPFVQRPFIDLTLQR